MRDMNSLILNIQKVNTTPLGQLRIRRNLALDTRDVVPICRNMILSPSARITRRGKNWYVLVDNCTITINAGTYNIITAHRLSTGQP